MPDSMQNVGPVDELQQAIDSIAADSQQGSMAGTPVVNVNDMPLPPQPAAPQNAVATTSNNEQVITGVETPVAPEASAAPAPQEAAPVAVMNNEDFSDLKKQALSELKTLAERVDLPAEDKFEIYREIITENGDKSCLQQAYIAAQAIADESEKVKALLFVVDTIKKAE